MGDESGIRKVRPGAYVFRAACSHLRSFVTGETPIEAARARYGQDPVTDLILTRAATGPAEVTGTPGWAKSLGGVAIFDMVQDATTYSAGAELIARGLQINLDGVAEYRVPGRLQSAANAGQWVGEGLAAPVKQLAFSNSALLHPYKLEVRYAYTYEQAEHTNIEAVVRQTLGEAVGVALDQQMLSADPGDATKPPGIFVNSDTITPTPSGGTAAMDKDLELLFKALASHSAGKSAVIIAAAPQAIMLKRNVGPKFDIDILTSTVLATGTVGVVEISSFVSGFSSVAEFSTTNTALLHMEDTAPTDITGGSPSPASPVRSMFQIEAIGLKCALWAAWGLRASHAHWIQSCRW